MPSNTDKCSRRPLASPGYETRDANVRGVFTFLVYLTVVLVFTLLVSWGLFRYFAAEQANPAPASPFAGTRQLPSGPSVAGESPSGFLEVPRGPGAVSGIVCLGKSCGRNRAGPHRARDGFAAPKRAPRRRRDIHRRGGQARTERGRETMRAITRLGFFAAIALIALPSLAQQASTPAILSKVGIAQRLNEQIPPDIVFRDESGKIVRLGDYFGKKPIVLSLVYFECPALCTEVLNGELQTMKAMSLGLGKDYDAVTVSFDPKDTPALAKAKRDVYAGQYGRPGAAENWHFLTGDQQSIDALTQAVGFHYAYDPVSRQYAHAAAIMVLTPEGRIARYFYGVEYPARDLRLGLVEASAGQDRQPDRPGAFVLLSLRSCDWKIRSCCDERCAWGRRIDGTGAGIFMFLMFRREHKRNDVLYDRESQSR